MNTTIVWGVAADASGLVHQSAYRSESLPGGGLRAERLDTYVLEPADSYADVHKAPIEMRWCHGDRIGQILALRRSNGRLLAVGETEIEPDDLRLLAEEHGDVRWSTGTGNLRGEPLSITEISLTPSPATVGLWSVRWHRSGVSKGNLPGWVREDVARADKAAFRSRGELHVFEAGSAGDEWEPLDRAFNPNEIHYHGGGWITAVEGRQPRGRGVGR